VTSFQLIWTAVMSDIVEKTYVTRTGSGGSGARSAPTKDSTTTDLAVSLLVQGRRFSVPIRRSDNPLRLCLSTQLCLARIKGPFEMNNIPRRRIMSLQPFRYCTRCCTKIRRYAESSAQLIHFRRFDGRP